VYEVTTTSAPSIASGSSCPRLRVDHAEPGQLLPQARLEAAEPQRTRWRVLQRAGLLDERAQRLELRLVQGEVRPVRQEQVCLPRGEGGEDLGERHVSAVHADADAQVEPVGAGFRLGGGDADPEEVPRLPVVDRPARDLDDGVRRIGEQRQDLRAEPHGVEPVEPDAGQQGRAGTVGPQQDVRERREVEGLEHRALLSGIPDRVVRGSERERIAGLRLTDEVGPLPLECERVAAAVRGSEHERRCRDGRRGE